MYVNIFFNLLAVLKKRGKGNFVLHELLERTDFKTVL